MWMRVLGSAFCCLYIVGSFRAGFCSLGLCYLFIWKITSMCEVLQGWEIRWQFLRTSSLGKCVTQNSHKGNMASYFHYANLIALLSPSSTLRKEMRYQQTRIQEKPSVTFAKPRVGQMGDRASWLDVIPSRCGLSLQSRDVCYQET